MTTPDPDGSLNSSKIPMNEMIRLKQIVNRLRSPGGCPWDLEQTPQSLRPFLLEEAHEAAEAIESDDPQKICEELGDLLMNILLQARIAEEQGNFTLEEVAQGIADKLVRRHPHVFGDAVAEDAAAVRQNWENIKRKESGENHQAAKTIRPLPASLPSLLRADRIGKMAAEVGFDWPDVSGAIDKVDEETSELKVAIESGSQEACQHEVGDLLFAVSSVCRKLDIDGEQALIDSLNRFRARFRSIDKHLEPGSDYDLSQLEKWYQEGKSNQNADEESS